jgi:hypothetical protein
MGEVLIDDGIKPVTDESFTSDYINSDRDYKKSDNTGSNINYRSNYHQ